MSKKNNKKINQVFLCSNEAQNFRLCAMARRKSKIS